MFCCLEPIHYRRVTSPPHTQQEPPTRPCTAADVNLRYVDLGGAVSPPPASPVKLSRPPTAGACKLCKLCRSRKCKRCTAMQSDAVVSYASTTTTTFTHRCYPAKASSEHLVQALLPAWRPAHIHRPLRWARQPNQMESRAAGGLGLPRLLADFCGRYCRFLWHTRGRVLCRRPSRGLTLTT